MQGTAFQIYNSDNRTMQLRYLVFYVDDFLNGTGSVAVAEAYPAEALRHG
jgi:hypothetical protein